MNPSNDYSIKILETPRDAMQGLPRVIPTDDKVELIDSLSEVGFDVIDIGSIVSERAVPQMKDTLEVLDRINTKGTISDIFILTVNATGAEIAANHPKVTYIGFPFSTSSVFLKKNINSNFEKAWKTINEIQSTCLKRNKKFMVYFSMAFGNPYGDPENIEMIFEWTEKFHQIGIRTISLSDITGVASSLKIEKVFHVLTNEFPEIEFGLHLHTKGDDPFPKLNSAFKNGCHLFEGVINGLGGCPMTGYELLGNLSTGKILEWANQENLTTRVEYQKYLLALEKANNILF